MNSLMTNQYPLFRLYQRMRGQLLDVLSDEELAFHPGGKNAPLGVLCREIGETEQNYINALKRFMLDFDYHHPDPTVERSISALRKWYQKMDEELEQVVTALTEDQVQNQTVARGPNFQTSLSLHLTIYQEALIIFYGKCSVYLKILGKLPSSQWEHWIA